MGYLTDYLNNKSGGRLLAILCVALASLCWIAGYWKKELVDYAMQGMRAFLASASIFYGLAKVPETVATVANKQENKGGIDA